MAGAKPQVQYLALKNWWCHTIFVPPGYFPKGLQTVASRVHFREQYRALVGHALVRARVLLLLLLLRALSVLGDTV